MTCGASTVLPLLLALLVLVLAAIYEGMQGVRLQRMNRALEKAVAVIEAVAREAKP
jgi:hypothetical protein